MLTWLTGPSDVVPNRRCEDQIQFGRYVFAAGAIGLGLAGLARGDFATYWQPVPDETPVRTLLAYLTAVGFIVGGMAICWRRTVVFGAPLLAALNVPFVLLWLKRIILFPQLFGTWSGCAEALVLVTSALLLLFINSGPARGHVLMRRSLQIAFGVCAILFGGSHFTALGQTASMVPPWIPPNQAFWAIVTGGAHAAAGVAIVTGVMQVPASRLLTAMFCVFGLFIWLPGLASSANNHMAWAGNALNLSLIGAAWIVADSISLLRRPRTKEAL